MHITGMTVGPSSHPAFVENISLEFDERVNLFIGPNASGKTSLLRVLADSGLVGTFMSRIPAVDTRISKDWESERELLWIDEWSADPLSYVPWIYIPATRITLPSELDDYRDFEVAPKYADVNSIAWPDKLRIFDSKWPENFYKSLHNLKRGWFSWLLDLEGELVLEIA